MDMSLAAAVLLLTLVVAVNGINVTYDHRAIIIDGQRRILVSGSVHYPRATPEMWPGLLEKAKQGGIDTIDTYVFWDGHEPSPGIYNFEERYNLTRFLKLVQEAGLYVILRIGPYVCAEWNFGGFPAWLLNIPGIQFRTNNEPFKGIMEQFVKKIVTMVKAENLFASQGGPIILAQIENEYGDVEGHYGENGKEYMLWAARMAEELDIGVPWVMCKQSDAPAYIINTCNGYYCDGWKPNSGQTPKIWTENWSGWFQSWGEAVPYRPVEDVAFAVARFFQRGGIAQNYYMYFGGTNFGRTSGGPFITTSYDYDSPIDEYGQIRQPKWGHLKELHTALKLCERAMTSSEPQYMSLGRMQEAHVYAPGSHLQLFPGSFTNSCAAFLANIDSSSSASVKFNGRSYDLPPWSVSVLPDCNNVVFNTAKVSAQTSKMKMKPMKLMKHQKESSVFPHKAISPLSTWDWYLESIGASGTSTIHATGLLDQIKITNDTTDYMWYSVRLQISEMDLAGARPVLLITSMRDMVNIYVNGDLAGRANTLTSSSLYGRVKQPIKLKAGLNEVAILSATVGLQNYGAYFDTWGAGINGSVIIQGLATGEKTLTFESWLHQAGLKGEQLHLFTGDGDVGWSSTEEVPSHQPLIWYKTLFDAPASDDPVAIDLGTMGKGQVWVNGESLGRFWPAINAPSTGCSKKCDYRGTYSSSKCYSGCGQPSQQWYHIPRDWLKSNGNTLVLFEEIGGNVSGISLATRVLDSICAQVSEYSLPPIDLVPSTSSLPELRLNCASGQIIGSIVFSSFGNPKGSCGGFQKGSCHAAHSRTVVEQACLGKERCSITIYWKNFVDDPCPGKAKTLAVEATCTSISSQESHARFID